ncbi:hypothetical protein E6W36_12340 [Hankyongella ginsenosidimutans]|uniref:Uncharacterized protein n=1 Tax=Hankyongella ginsenosidimutans TaxID=1763828 RepID=A0A4D7C7I0_9SPHN|nr:hypothetical protein [Hankyongella ginsenosidimutans]QCI80010.1 hypothetical protein E6W36_12340 [Hankyongella ginsenosidimutans]
MWPETEKGWGMMTLFSEMASWWLRAAAMQMQYWQSASDKWQETVGKMTGMMPKVDPRDSAPTLFPKRFFRPWMPAWMKGTDADTPVGAWPMPVHDTQDEPPAAPQVAVKPERQRRQTRQPRRRPPPRLGRTRRLSPRRRQTPASRPCWTRRPRNPTIFSS